MNWKNARLVFSVLIAFTLLFNVTGPAYSASQLNEESGSYQFYDDEGKLNELTVIRTNEKVLSQLYIEGELNQESVLMRESGEISGFKDFGDTTINTTASQVLDVQVVNTPTENHSNSPTVQLNSSSNWALIGTKYSETWDRYGYLYRGVSEAQSSEYIFNFSTGTALTTIASSIVAYVAFSAIAPGTIIALISGIVIGIVAGEIQSYFSGKFKTITRTENYEVYCNNKLGLRTLKEYKYAWGYNQYTGAEQTVFNGQSGGVTWSQEEMIDNGIYNVVLQELNQ